MMKNELKRNFKMLKYVFIKKTKISYSKKLISSLSIIAYNVTFQEEHLTSERF